jgi:hypothetical protein
MDAGTSIAMTFNNNNQRFAPLGVPHAGFASRGKGGGLKRLSLASPPKIGSISENPLSETPTTTSSSSAPRTSRSHLLAGLRTAPKTPGIMPNSAPYHHTSYNLHTPHYQNSQYPKTAAAPHFPANIRPITQPDHQFYALPAEQAMAPPNLDMDDGSAQMDQEVINQLYIQEMYLAQRQRELQQMINYQTATEQLRHLSMNGPASARSYPATPVTPQQLAMYAQHQLPVQNVQLIPQEIPGRPGQYVVYNPLTGQYTLAYDPTAHVAPQFTPELTHSPPPPASAVPERVPATYTSIHSPMYPSSRSVSPPKSASSPAPSVDGPFRRGNNSYGHSRTRSSLSLSSAKHGDVESAPKSAFIRPVGMPPTPMTGSFQQAPGGQRAGEHPVRQPYGPPPMEELKGVGNVNFKARARRSAFNRLVKAGTRRAGASDGEGSMSGESEKLESAN